MPAPSYGPQGGVNHIACKRIEVASPASWRMVWGGGTFAGRRRRRQPPATPAARCPHLADPAHRLRPAARRPPRPPPTAAGGRTPSPTGRPPSATRRWPPPARPPLALRTPRPAGAHHQPLAAHRRMRLPQGPNLPEPPDTCPTPGAADHRPPPSARHPAATPSPPVARCRPLAAKPAHGNPPPAAPPDVTA